MSLPPNDLPLEIPFPEGSCLVAYRGSIAHGMYVPNTDPDSIDDVDLMGVVVAPPEHYLGLTPWQPRGTQEIKQGKYDCVFYELQKIVGLLLKGNPNVMSLLWMPSYLYINDAGARLVTNRRLFVGKHVYKSFASYADQQLSKMQVRESRELRWYLALTYVAKQRGIHPNKELLKESPDEHKMLAEELTYLYKLPNNDILRDLQTYMKKGENIGYMGDKRKQLVLKYGYDCKNAAHCIRLLRMCIEFLYTGDMQVHRHDAAELMAIKRGSWTLAGVQYHAGELRARADEAFSKSTLPDGPNIKAAERLLVDILRESLCQPLLPTTVL